MVELSVPTIRDSSVGLDAALTRRALHRRTEAYRDDWFILYNLGMQT